MNTLYDLLIVLAKNHFRMTINDGIIQFEKGFPVYALHPKICNIFINKKLEICIMKGNCPSNQILAKKEINIDEIRKTINRNFDLISWVD